VAVLIFFVEPILLGGCVGHGLSWVQQEELMSTNRLVTGCRGIWILAGWSIGLGVLTLFSFSGSEFWMPVVSVGQGLSSEIDGGLERVWRDGEAWDESAKLRQQSRQKWEGEIAAMLRVGSADALQAVPSAGRSVLFYGSSSIRLWDSIATDVSPLVPTRCGFGGAKSIDLAVFAGEVLTAQTYDGLVIFVANDISGEANQPEYSPDQVIGWLQEVVDCSRAWQPTAPILLVEVTPTPKRWPVWPRQLALNLRLREWTLSQPGVEFLSTAEYFLDSEGRARETLFDADRLHLNSDGYRLWGRLIRRRVLEWLESAE